MSILFSWGENKPDDKLVVLMCEKAASYHFIRGEVRLVYGPRWTTAENPEPASYDRPCWHIRDDSTPPADSRGLEGCQAMMEGLYEGWVLGRSTKP